MAKKKLKGLTKFGIFLAGIISLAFGYILWTRILDLEQVFAIMFFVAGITKILWSFVSK
tara:strand:- start:834 stop:1010 length:177 start_codon:yes stop_codon:yes gene_type:complete